MLRHLSVKLREWIAQTSTTLSIKMKQKWNCFSHKKASIMPLRALSHSKVFSSWANRTFRRMTSLMRYVFFWCQTYHRRLACQSWQLKRSIHLRSSTPTRMTWRSTSISSHCLHIHRWQQLNLKTRHSMQWVWVLSRYSRCLCLRGMIYSDFWHTEVQAYYANIRMLELRQGHYW